MRYNNRKKEVIEDSPDWYKNKSNLIELMKRIISFYDLMGDKNRKQCAEIILKFLETSNPSNTQENIPPAPQSMEEGDELVKAEEEVNNVEEYPAEEQVKEEVPEVVNDESVPVEQREDEIKKITVKTIESTESTPSPNTSPTQKQENVTTTETVIKEEEETSEETIVYFNYYYLIRLNS